jgi:ppGpp synthetase/RelA/SpoT-type nucleotidyltranferase
VTEVDVESRAADVRGWYEAARWRFRAYETAVVAHLERFLRAADLENLQIDSRTKSLDSFVKKACKIDPVSGAFKYSSPRTEITDAVGVRLVVPLSSDVAPVRALLHERFVVEEDDERGTEDHVEVPGYQSLHLLVRLRDQDCHLPEFRDMQDMLVEVQVRTILQHAWASLQHDLMYKTETLPTPSTKRRLVALAGVLELADREFVQVRREHGEPVKTGWVAPPVAGGGAISAASLRQLVHNVVGEAETVDQEWFDALLAVLRDLGIRDREGALLSLGEWAGKAAQVASAVTTTRPYANAVYVFDQLLRLNLGEDYITRRRPRADLLDVEGATRAFMRDRAQLLRMLEKDA